MLLLLPVWKDCTNQKAVPVDSDIEVIETLDVSCNEVDTVSINDKNWHSIDMSPQETTFSDFLKIFEWNNCQSGYKQVWLGIDFFRKEKNETKNVENGNETKNTEDGKINSIKDIFSVFLFVGTLFSFTIYFLISIALTFFSFTKKRKTFIWLSGINLFIIIWSYISYFYFASNFYQIKFGFYMVIINALLIFLSNFLWKKKDKY
jgi:ABC-type multidrug transport system permease subunit